mmetsp:Transcript_118447/g.287444  ORF Transcript_118447/g.287444 Transcript_118447/m.287444 type:complete len:81 (-) Transcript_118447:891-1133(-)
MTRICGVPGWKFTVPAAGPSAPGADLNTELLVVVVVVVLSVAVIVAVVVVVVVVLVVVVVVVVVEEVELVDGPLFVVVLE